MLLHARVLHDDQYIIQSEALSEADKDHAAGAVGVFGLT